NPFNNACLLIHATTSSRPVLSFKFVKTNGLFPRNTFVSSSMTSRLAPTYGAKSVLLIMNRSDLIIPCPLLLVIFSPWVHSMLLIEMYTILVPTVGDRLLQLFYTSLNL